MPDQRAAVRTSHSSSAASNAPRRSVPARQHRRRRRRRRRPAAGGRGSRGDDPVRSSTGTSTSASPASTTRRRRTAPAGTSVGRAADRRAERERHEPRRRRGTGQRLERAGEPTAASSRARDLRLDQPAPSARPGRAARPRARGRAATRPSRPAPRRPPWPRRRGRRGGSTAPGRTPGLGRPDPFGRGLLRVQGGEGVDQLLLLVSRSQVHDRAQAGSARTLSFTRRHDRRGVRQSGCRPRAGRPGTRSRGPRPSASG